MNKIDAYNEFGCFKEMISLYDLTHIRDFIESNKIKYQLYLEEGCCFNDITQEVEDYYSFWKYDVKKNICVQISCFTAYKIFGNLNYLVPSDAVHPNLIEEYNK